MKRYRMNQYLARKEFLFHIFPLTVSNRSIKKHEPLTFHEHLIIPPFSINNVQHDVIKPCKRIKIEALSTMAAFNIIHLRKKYLAHMMILYVDLIKKSKKTLDDKLRCKPRINR